MKIKFSYELKRSYSIFSLPLTWIFTVNFVKGVYKYLQYTNIKFNVRCKIAKQNRERHQYELVFVTSSQDIIYSSIWGSYWGEYFDGGLQPVRWLQNFSPKHWYLQSMNPVFKLFAQSRDVEGWEMVTWSARRAGDAYYALLQRIPTHASRLIHTSRHDITTQKAAT
jgi:hypothetical protein